MNDMTIVKILLYWLRYRMNNGKRTVTNSDLVDAARFSADNFDVRFSYGSFERKFRLIRSRQKFKTVGIADIRDVTDRYPGSRETVWELIPKQ